MQGTTEVEVKIRIPNGTGASQRLQELGFQVTKDRVFEANVLYDTPAADLRAASKLLRLRQAGEHSVITFKGPGQPGPHKSREELETSVGSFSILERILSKLGFAASFRYEKYRTEWQRPGNDAGTVTIDETPIGWFLEVEGPSDWIDKTGGELGFTPANYILESYGRLYLTDCERRGVQPTHMTFAS